MRCLAPWASTPRRAWSSATARQFRAVTASATIRRFKRPSPPRRACTGAPTRQGAQPGDPAKAAHAIRSALDAEQPRSGSPSAQTPLTLSPPTWTRSAPSCAPGTPPPGTLSSTERRSSARLSRTRRRGCSSRLARVSARRCGLFYDSRRSRLPRVRRWVVVKRLWSCQHRVPVSELVWECHLEVAPPGAISLI